MGAIVCFVIFPVTESGPQASAFVLVESCNYGESREIEMEKELNIYLGLLKIECAMKTWLFNAIGRSLDSQLPS